VEDLPSGLLCRDVAAAGFEYDRAVEYWLSEGRPDRMDADRNGIPCETVYPSVDVTSYWGDPLPTTLIAGGPFTVDEPTYFPSPMPGSGDAFGSGCSPGTRWLPDGIWFGHVSSATSTVITFDLMCFAPAPEYEEAIGRITNDNPTLRDVPADPGAIVYAIAPHGDGWTVVPYTSWYTDPGREGFCPPEGCWDVWVYVNNGKATEVVQLWFP
jgi:hypothetical protein